MFITTFILLFLNTILQGNVSDVQTQAAAKQYMVALFTTGPAWDKNKSPGEQPGFKEHSKNLRRLRSEKKIVLGARYADKGLILLDAQSEEEARAMFATDPTVKERVFTLELYPWKTLFKSCLE